MKRVIIDNDGEFDDSCALVFALMSKELDIEAITTLSGFWRIDYVTDNVLNLLELVEREEIPVAMGTERPFFRDLTRIRQRLEEIYKKGGRPSSKPLRTPKLKPIKDHAVDLLISRIMENPGEISLVTLGGLTNVACALLREPRIAENVKAAYTMGGAVIAPGNITPVAEFNIWSDPEAARIYFNSGMPITMVGLEVYYSCNLTGKEWDNWKQGNAATQYILNNFEPWFKGIASRRPHLEGGEEIGDALTIGVLLDRSLVETKKMYIDVETKGELTTGQTVGYWVDPMKTPPKEPNVEVCVNVDGQRFNTMFMESVTS
jgi:purine nucleosidase